MVAVANVTKLSDSVNVSNVLGSVMSPALVKSTCMMNLMFLEGMPEGTMTKLLGKKGYLTAAASLAEATAQAINAELQDTSVTATVSKCALVSALSVEQATFGHITLDRIAEEHGNNIARYVDNNALSLFSSITTQVTSASVMTVDDVMLGQFNIFKSECPNKEVPLAAVLAHKGHYNIKKEIIQSGATAWVNPQFLDILQSRPQANCYVGSIPGLADFYATSGHATSGSNNVQAIFHPQWAFAGLFAPNPVSWINNRGAEGFYQEVATYYFFTIVAWNDLAAVALLSQ